MKPLTIEQLKALVVRLKKQVAKEIINLVEKSKFDVGNALYLQSIDDDCEVVSVDTLKFVIAENYGVEVEK